MPRTSTLALLAIALCAGSSGAEDGGPTSRIQGVWDFRTATPLQRPAHLGEKAFFTAEEAAAFEEQVIEQREEGQERSPSVHTPRWLDYGTEVQPSRRTSLIVDPPDGRLPPTTAAGRARQEESRTRARQPTRGYEDRTLWERCLLGFNAGPPMNPGAYNNNVLILETADTVVILNEMVHQARIVPLDGRPHLSSDIRQWLGDSRGRWEGDTLVVETTNFTDHEAFLGTGSGLHLVERFTRVDDDTLLYAYTIEDADTFERPFSAEIEMIPGGPIYEFACHEGNYGLRNILQAAAVEE